MERRYLRVRQLAKDPDCPLSENTLRKYISEGKLPHIKVTDRKYLIEYNTFFQWLGNQKNEKGKEQENVI